MLRCASSSEISANKFLREKNAKEDCRSENARKVRVVNRRIIRTFGTRMTSSRPFWPGFFSRERPSGALSSRGRLSGSRKVVSNREASENIAATKNGAF